MKSSRRRWSWPKRGVVAVASLVGAFLVWMLVLNIALWTGFVSWAVTGQYRMSGLDLEYDRAWVVWPTRVHVEGLELRIDAYRYQLELVIPEGELDIALAELLARRFHARSIEGEDVRATFRFKAHEGKVSEARRETFGEIEGVVDPVRLYGPPNVPEVDEAWEVQIDAIDGQLSSLWIDELEFAPMDGRLQGALRSRSGSLFAIDWARLDVRSSDLRIGGETMAVNWAGTLDASVADYNPFATVQRAVLRQLSLEIDAGADVVSMAALDPILASTKLNLREGKGPLDLRIHVDDGRLMPDTELLYRTDALAGNKGAWRGQAGVRFAFGVRSGERARAAAELNEVSLQRDDHAPITAEHISGVIEAAQIDLTAEELPIVGAELVVPKLTVPEVEALAGLANDLEPRDGAVELALHSEMTAPGRLVHELHGDLANVLVAKAATEITATGTFSINATSDAKLHSGQSEDVEVDVRWLAIKSKHGHSKGAWVQVHEGSVAWTHGAKKLSAHLVGRLDDLRPILTHLDDRKRLVELVPDLELTAPFDFDVELQRMGPALDIRVKRFDRPGLHIEGFRHSEGKRARSAFRLEHVQLGITRDESKQRNLDAGADEAWLARKIAWAKRL